MDHNNGCCTISLILIIYVANTILLYLSVQGNRWVNYDGGHSGLWNHCNNTHPVDNGTTNNSTEEKCDFIYMTEASVGLHHVRALYIIGFIIWCIGAIQRYLTWQHRGTKVDKDAIGAAMLCGLLIISAAFLFTFGVYHWDYSENSAIYVDPRFGVDHSLSFICASLAIFLGFLHIRLHMMLNRDTSSFSWAKHLPCFSPASRLRACCGKRDTRPEATTQQSSRQTGTETSESTTVDVSVISRDNPEYSSTYSSHRLQNILGILGAVISVRRTAVRPEWPGRGRRQSGDETGTTDPGDDISVVSAPGISEWSSRHSGGESNRHGRNRPPVDIMTLPPAYDEVVRDGSMQDNSPKPPPTYDEAIGNRESTLSPPPAYEESTS